MFSSVATDFGSWTIKGIVNAFDHMGVCLVLNLTTTCTYGKWAVIWPPNFATKFVSFATNFYLG